MKKLVYLSALLLIAACSTKPFDPKQQLNARLDSLLMKEFAADGPGGTVLIAKGDSVVFAKGYGYSDLNTKDPITTRTLFNLGSISKTFVMNSILMLRDEGKLSLEDSVIKYFPEFKNKEIGRKVKIKHLLTHTSGLPDNRQVNKDTVFYLTANDEQNWHPVTQTDTLVFEPGSQYEYSNPAYNGLALIIEKVSGMKWQQFVAERIFKPSGMSTSTITDGPHPESGVAHGYSKLAFKWSEDDYGEEPTFCAAGNGGVWSSAEELLKYQLAMNKVLFSNAATLAESRVIKTFPQWKSSEPPFIGWSWFMQETSDGLKIVGHTGTQGGFYCDYVSIPDKDILYVMLSNFPSDRDKMNSEVLRYLREAAWLGQ